MRRSAAALIMIAGLHGPPARAEGRALDSHQRELLLAGLEDLAQRLAVSPEGQRLTRPGALPSGLRLQSSPPLVRVRAGISLARTQVTLSGRPAWLLSWLLQAKEAGFACTAPLTLREDQAAAQLSVTLWSLGGAGPDPQAADSELTRLRDDLRWLERQQEAFAPLLRLLDLLVEAEAVWVSSAALEQGTLTVVGAACDPASREAFEKELRARSGELLEKPRVHLDRLKLPKPPQTAPGYGLEMQDLDPADAVLLAGRAGRIDLILADKQGPALVGSLRADSGEDLVEKLLQRIGLPHRAWSRLAVASPALGQNPPDSPMFSERKLSLRFRALPPDRVLSLLAEVSRVGLIPPPPSKMKLTLLVQKRPAREVAASVFWALGLVPTGSRQILAALPAGGKAPGIGEGPGPVVDLSAEAAPLARLVEALAGCAPVTACPPEDLPITLHLRKVPAETLLELLLASRQRKLARFGGSGLLLPAAAPPDPEQSFRCKEAGPADPPRGPDLLAAVLRSEKGSLALLSDGGRLRWVAEGAKLHDGKEVRRIRLGRVLLRAPDGRLTRRSPAHQEDQRCPGAGCASQPDPAAHPLSRLRLAGTAVLPTGAVAALLDPEQNLHLVRQGHPLGTRCGKVVEVLPGELRVSLGCAKAFDPQEVRLVLRPLIPE